MSYDSVLDKYRAIHQQSTVDELLGLWQQSRPQLNVYVHSPFCESLCRFCYYKGVKFDARNDSGDYKEYYYDYLPRSVKPFLPLLQAQPVGNYFFGGGTPSLMDASTMADVFDLFPGIRGITSKTFEVHPAIWQEQQLDVLADYGFNCCIIGIQSFDHDILLRQRRTPAPLARIQALVSKIRERGMYVALDIIYRMDPINADEIFRRDLHLAAELNADVISLQHNYNEISDEKHVERFFELISASALKGAYYWEQSPDDDIWMTVEKKKRKKCFRLVKNGLSSHTYREQVFPFVNSIDECSKTSWKDTHWPSVIGFGSLHNARKNTFSSIRGKDITVEYIEVNNHGVPEYFVTYQVDKRQIFRDTAALLARYKSVGPEPQGVSCAIVNDTNVYDDPYIIRRAHFLVALKVQWEARTAQVEDHLQRLQTLFPYMRIQDSSALIMHAPPHGCT